MHKLVVLYPEPHDREAFEEHYRSTHLPLAERLPGMLGWRYTLNVGAADGVPPYSRSSRPIFRMPRQWARPWRRPPAWPYRRT